MGYKSRMVGWNETPQKRRKKSAAERYKWEGSPPRDIETNIKDALFISKRVWSYVNVIAIRSWFVAAAPGRGRIITSLPVSVTRDMSLVTKPNFSAVLSKRAVSGKFDFGSNSLVFVGSRAISRIFFFIRWPFRTHLTRMKKKNSRIMKTHSRIKKKILYAYSSGPKKY